MAHEDSGITGKLLGGGMNGKWKPLLELRVEDLRFSSRGCGN